VTDGDPGPGPESGGRSDERRSVVLVTVDSLRADHCSYWGYDRETTPTLDGMAESGLVFERAVAPGPSTYESMPAVFTGRHMTTFPSGAGSGDGAEDALDVRTRTVRMNMATRTIPEWFADRGYATGAFTTNPFTWRHTPFARGFDRYEDFMDGGEGFLMREAAHLPVLSELKHVIALLRGDRASKRWTEYADQVVEWANGTDRPYFLWLFLLDTHTPYLTDRQYRAQFDRGRGEMYYHNWRLWLEKKWREEHDLTERNREALVDLYDAAVRSVDSCLSSLRSGLPDDPVFVVHSDHGEAFGEHGRFGHDAQLYEENLHVPLVVAGAEAEGTVSAPVSLVDLPGLVRSVAADGTPTLRGPPVLAKTIDGEAMALRTRNWKYICTVGPDRDRIRTSTAYDLRATPAERAPADLPSELEAAFRDGIERRLRHETERTRIVAGTRRTCPEGEP